MLKHSKCPLYIFPTSLLAYRKVRLLIRAWRRNCLYKYRALQIDTIGEVLRIAVDLKVHHRCLSLRKSRKHWRAPQHVDVIVSSCHSKESMLNPKVLICHRFKYHAALSGVSFVQSLPSKQTVVPTPMHAIDALKHLRKSSSCVLCQDSISVLLSWGSQIVLSKHNHHRSTKSAHSFKARRLCHA
jgi:hypothetical protein